jgi:hypothetical protein
VPQPQVSQSSSLIPLDCVPKVMVTSSTWLDGRGPKLIGEFVLLLAIRRVEQVPEKTCPKVRTFHTLEGQNRSPLNRPSELLR